MKMPSLSTVSAVRFSFGPVLLLTATLGQQSYLDKIFERVQSGTCEFSAEHGQPEDDTIISGSLELTEAGWKVGGDRLNREGCERLCAEDSAWCHFIAFQDDGNFNNKSTGGCYLFHKCSPSLDDAFSDYSVYKESDNCSLDGIWNTNFGQLIVSDGSGTYGDGGLLSNIEISEDGFTVGGSFQNGSQFGTFELEFGIMCESLTGSFISGSSTFDWAGSRIGGTCLHGETFLSCGRSWNCAPTCSNPTPKCLGDASMKCVARCQCPPGKPILHNGHCVSAAECPTCLELNVYGDDSTFEYSVCPVDANGQVSDQCATGSSEGLRCNTIQPSADSAYKLTTSGTVKDSPNSPVWEFKWGHNVLYAGAKAISVTTGRLTNDDQCLRVIIEPDAYQEDIAWEVTGPGDRSTTVAAGDYLGLSCISLQTDACYDFSISDEYGDGLNKGEGTYFLAWGSQLIESPTGGDYGEQEKITICGPDVSKVSSSGEGGKTCLNVHVTADQYPEDVSWSLYAAEGTSNPLKEGDASGLSCFEAEAGECYTFEINDQFGDGLCCNQGNGGYTVSWGDEVVAESNFEGKAQERVMVCDPVRPCLEVQITPDRYPDDVSWELKTWGGALIASGNAEGSQCIDTDEDELQFIIRDSYGDGICCQSGTGEYKVLWNGETVASGGSYEYEEVKEITKPSVVGGDVAQRKRFLQIKIVPDRYPEDTTWELVEDRTGDVVAEGARDANERVDAVEGQSYTLKIMDAYADGFCCQWGSGHAVVEWDGKELDAYRPTSSERFALHELKFTVPAAEDSGCLKVDISADAYPEDISWELADNITAERVAQGSNGEGKACHRTTPGTCYEFRIFDSYGDGLGLGAGTYSISWAGSEWYSRSHGDYGSSEMIYGICDPDTEVRVANYEQTHPVLLVGHTWEEDAIKEYKDAFGSLGICYYTIYLDQEHDKVDLSDAFVSRFYENSNGATFPFSVIGGAPINKQQLPGLQGSLVQMVRDAGGAVGDECSDVYKKLKCMISSNPVVIIGRSWCGYTRRAIQLMIDNDICTSIIQMDALGDFQTPVYNYLKTTYNYYTTPYVFINGEHVLNSSGQGGYYGIVGNWQKTGGLWQGGNGPLKQMITDAGGSIGGNCGAVTRKAKSDAEGVYNNGSMDASIWWDNYECQG